MPSPTNDALHPLARLRRSPLFWVALTALMGCTALLMRLTSAPEKPLPDLGQVPAFSLTDQTAKRFGSPDLTGRVWVANFIFTRCTTVCPIFSDRMARLQDATQPLSQQVRLVSFSVDPEYDTPDVLAPYAARFGAKPEFWYFLTGPISDIRSVVIDGMKTYMGDASTVENPEALMHGSHFVLVDPRMKIRGYYSVDDDDTTARLSRDISRLLAEE